ncbi:MAG: hypothetical protein IKZ12_05090 [Alistipes sp.]|nr:hypothetical protein [Alistipes sp.]
MKNFLNKLVAVLMMALATVGYSCSECDHEPYDDTELRGQIADLYAQLQALQATVNANMTTLQGMINGLTTVKSHTQDSNGNWVFELSDGTQFTVYAEYEPEALPSSLIHVMEVEIDGVKTLVWATVGADGQLTPLKDGENYLPVVQETPEIPTLEYKAENGKIYIKLSNATEWIETGMTNEALDKLLAAGNAECASGITGWEPVMGEDRWGDPIMIGVTFTLADGGTFTVELDSDDEMSFGFYQEGMRDPIETYYLAPGKTDSYIQFRTNGLVDFIKEVPEGWALTINGSEEDDFSVKLTAPTAEAIAANASIAEGVVKLFGVFEDGTSAVLKMNVTATNPWKTFSVSHKKAVVAAYNGVEAFVYGVKKAADYDPSTIKETVANELASYSAKFSDVWSGLAIDESIEDIYGAELEEGVEYIFYVATYTEKMVGYDWVTEITSEFTTKTICKPTISVEQTAATFNSISVKANLKGFDACYAMFGPKGWMSVEEFVEDQINYWADSRWDPDCIYTIGGEYTLEGAIQKLPMVEASYEIAPDTEYFLYIIPAEEGKKIYAVEDVTVCTFKSAALVSGGSITVETPTINVDFTSANTTLTATGAKMIYYMNYAKADVPADEATLVAELLAGQQYVESEGYVRMNNLAIGTEYVLVAMAIDSNGAYAAPQKFAFSTKAVTFTSPVTVTIDQTNSVINQRNGKLVWNASGEVQKYLYFLDTADKTQYTDTMGGTPEAAAKYMVVNQSMYYVGKTTSNTLDYTFGYSNSGKPHILIVVAIDAEGNFSQVASWEFTPTW